MASYPGKKRRFSEPEKPTPRFRWRDRVNSLMSSEENKFYASKDHDTETEERRYFDFKQAIEVECEQFKTGAERRRDRFRRTHIDGKAKSTVRFSKDLDGGYADAAKSEVDQSSVKEESRATYRSRSRDDPAIYSNSQSYTASMEHPASACSGGQENQYLSFRSSESSDAYSDSLNASCGCYGEQESFDFSSSEDFSSFDFNDARKKDNPHKFMSEDSKHREMHCKLDNLNKKSLSTETKAPHGPKLNTIPVSGEDKTRKSSYGDNADFPNDIKDGGRLCVEQSDIGNGDQHVGHASAAKSKAIDVPGMKASQDERRSNAEEVWYEARTGSAEEEYADKLEQIIQSLLAEEQEKELFEDEHGYNMSFMKQSIDMMSREQLLALNLEAKQLKKTVAECNEETSEDGNESFYTCRLSESSDDDEDYGEYHSWADLPAILLEDIFTFLTPKARHSASQVCSHWYDLFYSPRVWETFILYERTLTKRRYNLYKGYQREICPMKAQMCFRRVGSFFKRIIITPISDYFNLYEFLRSLAAFLHHQEEHSLIAMPLLHTFDFTFACATWNDEGETVHGTGGQILGMIKELLCRINNLKHLKLNQLMLDVMETVGLFDSIAACFGESLVSLEILNVTKIPLALPELTQFRNILKLVISPQHLNEEVLVLISGLNLLNLHILQDAYTCDCPPVSYEAWKLVREMAPWLRVYLEVSGMTKSKLLIQPRAPVYGIFLRTPYSKITNDLVMSVVEYYSKTLNYFVQDRLPRVHGPRGIDTRCDSSLLFLVRRCPRLQSLVIAERISTSTMILLANENRHLRTFIVRQNALIKRCDWSKHGEWSNDFYNLLRETALDYDRCNEEMCRLLRRRWHPMTDKKFQRLKISPKLEVM